MINTIGSIELRDLKTFLEQNDIWICSGSLDEWMVKRKYLDKDGLPTLKSMDKGLMYIKEGIANYSDRTEIEKTTMITHEGLSDILQKIMIHLAIHDIETAPKEGCGFFQYVDGSKAVVFIDVNRYGDIVKRSEAIKVLSARCDLDKEAGSLEDLKAQSKKAIEKLAKKLVKFRKRVKKNGAD